MEASPGSGPEFLMQCLWHIAIGCPWGKVALHALASHIVSAATMRLCSLALFPVTE